MQEYVAFIQIGLLPVLILGFAGLTVGEMLFLKKKAWLDEKQSRRYPIITNLVNLPIAFVSYLFSTWVLFAARPIGVGAAEFYFQKDNPVFADSVVVLFHVLVFVVPFLVYLMAFFFVRLLTTAMMVEPLNLTLRYQLAQAGLSSALLMIVSFLFTAAFFLRTC